MSSQTVVLRRPDRLAVLVSTKKEPQAWELVEQPLAEAPLAAWTGSELPKLLEYPG